MEISQDQFHQNKTCEPGAVAGCIEHGNEDSKFKCGSPIVEVGGIGCNFTSLVYGTPTDLLNYPTAAGNFIGISNEEESEGYVVTNDSGTPVPCKSACPSTIFEADLSKCGTTKETNGFSVENNDNAEEKSLQLDDGNITGHNLTPLVDGNNDESSKCLGSIEEKVSGVENGHGNSDTAARNSLSRERKKSKYLCYPFINLGKESKVLPLPQSEIEDSKSPGQHSIQDGDSFSLVKCGKRKRESRKSLTNPVTLEAVTASSAELLMQLQSVATDHLNFYFNSSFDPTELLFNRFRASVFRGLPDSEVIGVLDEEDPDFHALVENQNKEPVTEEKKPPLGLYNVNVNFSPAQLPADSNTKPRRKRKKKEATMSASEGPNRTEGEPGKKKRIRKKGTTPEISYINGNNVKPISLEVCLQDAGPYPMAAENATHEKSSDEVTIDQMKKSLELMTSMLEKSKSASAISPETRASLEKEIKSLLQKVMAKSSST